MQEATYQQLSNKHQNSKHNFSCNRNLSVKTEMVSHYSALLCHSNFFLLLKGYFLLYDITDWPSIKISYLGSLDKYLTIA